MDLEEIRSYCLSFPHATEKIQWGDDLLFCVAGKMFTVVALSFPAEGRLSFKCTPEKYAELTELEGVIPAPYMARHHWVSLERIDALEPGEIKSLIKESYSMIFDKLPRKVKVELSGGNKD